MGEQARTRAGRAIALEEMPSERRKASGRDTNVTATPVTRGIVSSFDMAQRKTCTSMPSERGAEDFSMTERLSRSATVRRYVLTGTCSLTHSLVNFLKYSRSSGGKKPQLQTAHDCAHRFPRNLSDA